MTQPNLEMLMRRMRRNQDRKDRIVSALAARGKPVKMKTNGGNYALAQANMVQGEKPFRLTYFGRDAQGRPTPWGHTEHTSLERAIGDGYSQGYKRVRKEGSMNPILEAAVEIAKAKKGMAKPKTKAQAARRAERYARFASATSDPRLARIASLEAERMGPKPKKPRNDKNNDGYTDGAKPKGAPRKKATAKPAAAPERPSTYSFKPSPLDGDKGAMMDPKQQRAREQNASMQARLEANDGKPWKSAWYRPMNLAGERSTNTSAGGVHDGFAAVNDPTWRRAADWARGGDRKAFDAARAATKTGSRERMMLERGWNTTRANQRNPDWVDAMRRAGVITKRLGRTIMARAELYGIATAGGAVALEKARYSPSPPKTTAQAARRFDRYKALRSRALDAVDAARAAPDSRENSSRFHRAAYTAQIARDEMRRMEAVMGSKRVPFKPNTYEGDSNSSRKLLRPHRVKKSDWEKDRLHRDQHGRSTSTWPSEFYQVRHNGSGMAMGDFRTRDAAQRFARAKDTTGRFDSAARGHLTVHTMSRNATPYHSDTPKAPKPARARRR